MSGSGCVSLLGTVREESAGCGRLGFAFQRGTLSLDWTEVCKWSKQIKSPPLRSPVPSGPPCVKLVTCLRAQGRKEGQTNEGANKKKWDRGVPLSAHCEAGVSSARQHSCHLLVDLDSVQLETRTAGHTSNSAGPAHSLLRLVRAAGHQSQSLARTRCYWLKQVAGPAPPRLGASSPVHLSRPQRGKGGKKPLHILF